jgi:hypothetical protein
MCIEMIINWISGQLSSINVPTVLMSMVGNWLINNSLQKRQAKLDKDLEATKAKFQQDIQNHCLQAQLKAATLYKIYPELSSIFREAYGSVYQAFYHGGPFVEKAIRTCRYPLTQIFAKHSILLDPDLSEKCIKAKDALIEASNASLRNLDEKEKEAYIENIDQQVNALCDIMRSELFGKN